MRLPDTLYQGVKRLARERGVSINRLAQQELERVTQLEQELQLGAAYEALGAHDESSVEHFVAAQAGSYRIGDWW